MDDLTRAPRTDPTPLYRTRDDLYVTDMLIAALTGLDLFSWLASRSATVDEVAEMEAWVRDAGFERPRIVASAAGRSAVVARRA